MPKVATITVAPERRPEVLGYLAEHRAWCLRDEPNTLVFEVMAPNDEPDRVMTYEVYTDKPGFDRHWNGTSIETYRQQTSGIAEITGAIWGAPLG